MWFPSIIIKKIRAPRAISALSFNYYFSFFLPLRSCSILTSSRFFNLQKEVFSVFRYFFLKVQFFGKTFRWVFYKNKIKFRVQRAHKVFLLVRSLRFKKKKKLKFKLRIFNKLDFCALISILKKIKYINIFTKKGLRVLKTRLKKKRGKISGYMTKYA